MLIIKGFLATRRLLFLDAKFGVISLNSVHECCTCSLFSYVDVIFFCFKGRCSLENLIIYCMCYFQYNTCVKHRVNSCSTTHTTNDYIVKLINFLKERTCYSNFVVIILKACPCLLDFGSRSQKYVQENWLQIRWGSIQKSQQKSRLCYAPSHYTIK